MNPLIEHDMQQVKAAKGRSDQLAALLNQMNFAKTCHWLRLCKERSATSIDDQIRIANEVLSMGALDTVAASQSAWAQLHGGKPIKAPAYKPTGF